MEPKVSYSLKIINNIQILTHFQISYSKIIFDQTYIYFVVGFVDFVCNL